MKFGVAILLILFLCTPVSSQVPLGVNNGDSFSYVIKKYSSSSDNSEKQMTYKDMSSSNQLVLKQGDTFTVTIVNATIDNNTIIVDITSNGNTVRNRLSLYMYSYVIVPDWENYTLQAANLNGSIFTYTTSSTEFMIAADSHMTGLGMTYDYHVDIRYELSTGVLTRLVQQTDVSQDAGGTTTKFTSVVKIYREGYEPQNNSFLPGFEFYWLGLLFLVPMIRRKYAFSTDFFHN